MVSRERRPAFLDGVVHLPQQVFEVLPGQPREAASIKSFGIPAMAGCTGARIELRVVYARSAWIKVMKGAISKNASYFNSHRMMRRYGTEAYLR